MKWPTLILCAASLALSACSGGQPGDVYDMPVDQVYAVIARTNIPDDLKKRVNSARGSEVRVSRVTNQSVTWKLTEYGHEIARFVATVTPEGDDGTKTRVTVDAIGAEEGKFAKVGQEFNNRGLLVQTARMAMEEQISSKMQGRGYDERKVAAAIAAYAITHADEIQADLASPSNYDDLEHPGYARTSGAPAQAYIPSATTRATSAAPSVSTAPAVSTKPSVNLNNNNY
jgi:hypothetical protein